MSGNAPESVVALLRKIHALATRGIAGEAKAAQAKLEELLGKHGITIGDLEIEQKKIWEFPVRNKHEEKLVRQCAAAVTRSGSFRCFDCRNRFTGRKLQTVGIELTHAQYVDLREMFAYYKQAWKKEQDRLLLAFIYRHRLVPPPSDDPKDGPDFEELTMILRMMRGLGEKSWAKPRGLLPDATGDAGQ